MFGLFKSNEKNTSAETLGRRTASRINTGADRVTEKHVVPVLSEELNITKNRVQGDTVRVDLHTETELTTAQVELMHDAVDVTRVPVDRPVLTLPLTRTEGATTIIPVVRERLVVKKELVLVEEIHISHERQTQTLTKDVELRRQVPEITRTPTDSPS